MYSIFLIEYAQFRIGNAAFLCFVLKSLTDFFPCLGFSILFVMLFSFLRIDPNVNALVEDSLRADIVETRRLYGKLAKAGLF